MESLIDTLSLLIKLAGIISIAIVAYSAITGILSVLYKLGLGLANRKIYIFAKGDNYASLNQLILESKIFKEKNIQQIHKNLIDNVDDNGVFLVYWSDFKDEIDTILSMKKNRKGTALIVYTEVPIDSEIMKKINNTSDSIVVNFRGRLLNDILISLITTRYKK